MSSHPSSPEQRTYRRDAIAIVAVTLVSWGLFSYLEWYERVFEATRRWETFELDELPSVLGVLALGLTWFAWRRYRESREELARRRAAEIQLETLLQDNRKLTQQHMQAQESERKILARELHDELGQYLNAIKTDAVRIQEKVASGPPALTTAAAAIIEHADHVHAVVRNLLGQLRPVALDELGLKAALEHFVYRSQQRLPQVKFTVWLGGDLDGLSEPVSLAIYRLTQEGVTNMSRHSSARSVHIHIARIGIPATATDAIQFEIADDGQGAELERCHAGLGLAGMRDRVETLGGRLAITTGSAQGFSVAARIPLPAEGLVSAA